MFELKGKSRAAETCVCVEVEVVFGLFSKTQVQLPLLVFCFPNVP